MIEQFIADLIAEFDTQTVVKVSISAFGDYRNGQVETVLGPVQFATESELVNAVESLTW